MKCPNCGGEIKNSSRVCEYCGSSVSLQMAREQEKMNRAGCPRCGSSNISFHREKQGEIRNRKGMVVVRSTVGVCRDCGHTWQTTGGTPASKKKNWLWILGWICMFPVPLTILLSRKKDMKPALKYGIIALAWILYLAIGLSGGTDTDAAPGGNDPAHQNGEVGVSLENCISGFVDSFNADAGTALVFTGDFTPSDEKSTHYRTEFRLPAYSNAVGKSFSYGGATVDVVAREDVPGSCIYRVYVSGATLEQCIEVVETASPVMDPALTVDGLRKAVGSISEHKSANGYSYGELDMVLTGSDADGYEMMLKFLNG